MNTPLGLTITIEALGDGQYIFKLRDADDLNTVIREEIGGAEMLDTMLDMIAEPELPVTLTDVANTLEDVLGCGRNSTSGAVYATQDDWDMVEKALHILRTLDEDCVSITDFFDE